MRVALVVLIIVCAMQTPVMASDEGSAAVPDPTAALYKPSYQSSDHHPEKDPANHGNDGNRDGVWEHRSVFHTLAEIQPWYLIDLLVEMTVTGGNITNRFEVHQRLRNGVLAVGSVFDPSNTEAFDPTSFTICADDIQDTGAGLTQAVSCGQPIAGRYVVFYLKLTSPGFLHLAELEVTVNNNPLQIVSQQKPVFASTNQQGHGFVSNVVDGNLNGWDLQGSCFASKPEDNPYIVLDLIKKYQVRFVTIKNRSEGDVRIQQLYVYVDNMFSLNGDIPMKTAKFCDFLPGPYASGEVVAASCPGKLKGRFVVLCQAAFTSLSTCEVTVFISTGAAPQNV